MAIRDDLLQPKASGCITCRALRLLTPADAALLKGAIADRDVPHVDIAEWLKLNGHPVGDAKSVANHRKSHVDNQG